MQQENFSAYSSGIRVLNLQNKYSHVTNEYYLKTKTSNALNILEEKTPQLDGKVVNIGEAHDYQSEFLSLIAFQAVKTFR